MKLESASADSKLNRFHNFCSFGRSCQASVYILHAERRQFPEIVTCIKVNQLLSFYAVPFVTVASDKSEHVTKVILLVATSAKFDMHLLLAKS